MTWQDETREVYRRPATGSGSYEKVRTFTSGNEERVLDAVLETIIEDDGKPSRDSIAFCGTAMLISGVVVLLAFSSWVGAIMAVCGFAVFCTAWAKRND